MTYSSLLPVTVMVIGTVACVFDLRTRRIPNVLTFGAALLGLFVQTLSGGTHGALSAAGGWLVGMILFLPFFALGGMGGGDVKLLAALGAWLGPQETIWLALYSGVAGGILGVIVAVSQGYLRTALRNMRSMVAYWGAVGFKPVPDLTLESAKTPRLAYALPILAGVVMTLWR
jgi:prepilin peptidase CpaA